MKYCPSCLNTYADETLRFCLQDGTGLLDAADTEPAPTLHYSEKETVVRQSPVTTGFQPDRPTQAENARVAPPAKKSSMFPAIVVTALVMCVIFGGLIAAWKIFGGASDKDRGRNNTAIPELSPSIMRTPLPTIAPTRDRNPFVDDIWQPIDNNASLNGTNLTYYRGTTPEQCKADCEKNPNCKGFTLIRAGAYNPNDPPMCYLASEVTGSSVTPCCVSGIKK